MANPLICLGGAERDRTVDLMTASHALSQLSYSPLITITLDYTILLITVNKFFESWNFS